MPVTPHDLKDFAEGDVSSPEETRRRASVSRAYYAVFHAVLPFASQLPRSAKCYTPPECFGKRPIIDSTTR